MCSIFCRNVLPILQFYASLFFEIYVKVCGGGASKMRAPICFEFRIDNVENNCACFVLKCAVSFIFCVAFFLASSEEGWRRRNPFGTVFFSGPIKPTEKNLKLCKKGERKMSSSSSKIFRKVEKFKNFEKLLQCVDANHKIPSQNGVIIFKT